MTQNENQKTPVVLVMLLEETITSYVLPLPVYLRALRHPYNHPFVLTDEEIMLLHGFANPSELGEARNDRATWERRARLPVRAREFTQDAIFTRLGALLHEQEGVIQTINWANTINCEIVDEAHAGNVMDQYPYLEGE